MVVSGSGTRVPLVLATLASFSRKLSANQTVNAEEAVSFGSAYHGHAVFNEGISAVSKLSEDFSQRLEDVRSSIEVMTRIERIEADVRVYQESRNQLEEQMIKARKQLKSVSPILMRNLTIMPRMFLIVVIWY